MEDEENETVMEQQKMEQKYVAPSAPPMSDDEEQGQGQGQQDDYGQLNQVVTQHGQGQKANDSQFGQDVPQQGQGQEANYGQLGQEVAQLIQVGLAISLYINLINFN